MTRDKKTEAEASLLLELSRDKEQIHGHPVSDEELAAYVDNRLNSSRRAQIDSHIANDPQVYARWMDLVENLDFITEPQESKRFSLLPSIKSLSESLKALFPQTRQQPWIYAGATAVMALVFFLPGKQDHTINELYRDYRGLTESTLILPGRSYNPLSDNENQAPLLMHDKEKIVFGSGVHKGLTSLGVIAENQPYEKTGELQALQQAHSNDSLQFYTNLGRWTAITALQCAQTAKASKTFFDRSASSLDELITESRPFSADSALQKALGLITPGASMEQLCELSRKLIAATTQDSR